MPRLADIEARLASIGELGNVIGAMRALAAVRMRQATDALRAARAHADTIRAAHEAARLLLAEEPASVPTSPPLIVVFSTEHGFAGAFNERLLDPASEARRPPLIVVGSRGALLASERGLDVVATLPAASHPSGALDVARRTSTAVYEQLAQKGLDRADVIFGRSSTFGAPAIERARLLPIERSPAASLAFPPLHHLESRVLVERLAAELVIADLARIAVESLAAESAARLQTMSAARDNIERKLGELRQAEHHARQDQVTMELLDLATGVEALARGDVRASR